MLLAEGDGVTAWAAGGYISFAPKTGKPTKRGTAGVGSEWGSLSMGPMVGSLFCPGVRVGCTPCGGVFVCACTRTNPLPLKRVIGCLKIAILYITELQGAVPNLNSVQNMQADISCFMSSKQSQICTCMLYMASALKPFSDFPLHLGGKTYTQF